jgi:hypothetical protein
MEKKKFVYYQDGDLWYGWLEEFPDCRTQGRMLKERKENLKGLHDEFTSGRIPGVRRVGELTVA